MTNNLSIKTFLHGTCQKRSNQKLTRKWHENDTEAALSQKIFSMWTADWHADDFVSASTGCGGNGRRNSLARDCNSPWRSFPQLYRRSSTVSASLWRPPVPDGWFAHSESNTGQAACNCLYTTSRAANTQSPTTIALRRQLWFAVFSVAGRQRFVLESSLQWPRTRLIYNWLMTSSRCVREWPVSASLSATKKEKQETRKNFYVFLFSCEDSGNKYKKISS